MLQLRKNSMVVGRAATGIYLIFNNCNKKGKALYPANICYAAIYPAIYAGMSPVFCDVDPSSGNVTYEIIRAFVEQETELCAMVLPHMYGNPIRDIARIKALCQEKQILLIEDCASAMGAKIDQTSVGCFGDYVIYSTGYAKTIDVGFGGIVTTDLSIEDLKKDYAELVPFSEQIEENEAFFSKMYRLIRNSKKQNISKYIFLGLQSGLNDMFIYKVDEDMEHTLLEKLDELDSVIAKRKYAVEKYNDAINDHPLLEKYSFDEGAVPWRYNLLVEPHIRKELIEYLLENHIPVSDWYPSVTEMFGDTNVYVGVRQMEQRIINFPLLVEDGEIDRICLQINRFMEDVAR